jgi:hypothetical protein
VKFRTPGDRINTGTPEVRQISRALGPIRMPFPLQRTRAGFQAVTTIAQVIGLLILPIGCELIHPDHQPEPAPPVPSAEGRELVARAAPPTTLPGKFATRRGYYVFYTDFEPDKNDPAFTELEDLPDQVFGELRLPPSNNVVQVFLFDTQERYERFMRLRHKELPPRRAYFLQEPGMVGKDDLNIYTWMGDHIRADLRHELTHALLHGVLKDVPLWLDEGLAGYFELPPANQGVNPQHLDILRRGPFQPDLARLEKLEQVKQMGKPEYREAWAWVHLMLRSDPAAKKVLQDYLQLLRTNSNPGPLLPRLRDAVLDPEQDLIAHLEKTEVPQPRARGK